MADKQMVPIPAGSWLILSEGVFSNYHAVGLFRTKVDIDPESLRLEYLMANPEQSVDYEFDAHQFMAWLSAKDLMDEVPYYEWCMGSYSCADLMEAEFKGPDKQEG